MDAHDRTAAALAKETDTNVCYAVLGPRPMQISVNGVAQPNPIEFPVTGAWTEWGKVFTQVQLLTGSNTVTISAIANSGPNLDYIEVFPLGDESQGVARVAVDNGYMFFGARTAL